MQQESIDSLCYMDCHTHMLDYPNSEQIQQTVKYAIEKGVKKIVVNTTTNKQFQELEKLCDKYGDVIVCGYGIHPCYVSQQQEIDKESGEVDENGDKDKGWVVLLKKMLMKNQRVSVGEIGLDFRTVVLQRNSKQLQMEYFKIQIEIAMKLDRPVTVHCIRAYGEIVKILKEMNKMMNGQRKLHVIMHSYGGSRENTRSLLKLMNMQVYFSLSMNRNVQLCSVIPIERLVCQTDAPYQNNMDLLREWGMLGMNRYLGRVQEGLMKVEGNQEELEQKLKGMLTNEPVNMIANVRSLCKYYEIVESKFVEIIYQNSMKAFKIQGKK